MALTIAIEGKGVIANADASPDTAMAGSAWNEDGAGTDSFTTDTFLYGTTSFAGAYSNKSGFQYYDIGAANVLDFDVGGTEEDQFIYMWIHCPTLGLVDTIANKGLAIRIGTDLTKYREFIIAGSDDTNGWNGEWKCFVIDPTKAGSVADTGVFDVGNVRYMGVWIDTTAIAKGDNIFISQISVGSGLRISGTSTQGWEDVVDYCTDYPNRAWGMFIEREGIYFAQGMMNIGKSNQTANVSFKDSGRIIKWAKSEYYSIGGSWVTFADIGYSGINVEDSAANTTVFEDGVLVGTDNGRSGSQFIGNSILNVSVDLYGGNNAASTTKLYNTTLKELTGSIVMGNDADHLFYGGTVNKCKQFDPVGAPKIRNCVFSETVDTDAALLWNENIDIEDCNFIANVDPPGGAGIEMPSNVGTPYDFDDLIFSGNTKDVLNSSGAAITITKTGTSDPTTSEGAAVTFSGSVTITVTVKDTDGAVIAGVQTAVHKTADRTELMNEDTNAAGVASQAYTGATPVEVEVRCRKASLGATKYINFSSIQNVVASSGLSLSVILAEDTENNATS